MILALTSILAALSASQQAGDERARLQQLEGRLGLQKKAPVGPYAARLIWSLKQHGIIPTMMATAWLRDSLSTTGLGQGPLHQEFPSEAFYSPHLGLSSDGKAIEAVLLDPATSGRHPDLEARLAGDRYFPGPPERTQKGQWRPSFDYKIGVLAPVIPWAAAHFSRWLKVKNPMKNGLEGTTLAALNRALYQAYSSEMGGKLEAAGVERIDVPWSKATDMGQLLDWMRSPDGSKVWNLDLQDAFTAAKDWHDELARLRSDGAAPPGVVIASWPDGYTLHRLVTQQQLEAEGETMGHCVGGYWSKVRDEGHVILSLRDAKGKSVATLDIKGTWEALAGGGTGSPIALGEDGDIYDWYIYDLEGPENEEVVGLQNQLKVIGVLKALGVELGDSSDKLPDVPAFISEDDLSKLIEVGKHAAQNEETLQTYRGLFDKVESLIYIIQNASLFRWRESDTSPSEAEILSETMPDAIELHADLTAAGMDVEEIGGGDLDGLRDWLNDASSSLEGDIEFIQEEAGFGDILEEIDNLVQQVGGDTDNLHGESRLDITLPNGSEAYIDIRDDALIFWEMGGGRPWLRDRSELGDYSTDPAKGLMLLDGIAYADDVRYQPNLPVWAKDNDGRDAMLDLTTPDLPNFLNFAANLGLDLDRNALRVLRRFNQ